jgi:opacity protein-like surface antigen
VRRLVPGLRAIALAGVLAGAPASAQTPGPGAPGPYVIDLRGALASFPATGTFYPTVPAGTVVPSRGFGLDVGAHVYPLSLKRARVGVGASLLVARGTTTSADAGTTDPLQRIPDMTTTARLVSPQLSINFGTRDGWSTISAGYDAGRLTSRASGSVDAEGESGTLTGFNVGGGARWFISSRFAVGFDIRWHSLSGTKLFSGSAGVSLR